MTNIQVKQWRLLLNLLTFSVVLVSGILVALVLILVFPGWFSAETLVAVHLKAGVFARRQVVVKASANIPLGNPDASSVAEYKENDLILYGKDLIVNTSKYFGPHGSVLQISNGMNCQNCHLEAGTKIMGNNYTAVYATYPKFRARSASKETIVKRVSDCFERSLNGKMPDSSGREMKAMLAYIKWVGKDVTKGVVPKGAGINKLVYLDRAADPNKGMVLYKQKCESCHGVNGQGISSPDDKSFIYPPLWGNRSYNDGAGLYRISSFAGFIKDNMPFGASYENTVLTDQQAWDLAAFVNSQPRPHKDQTHDWKDISQKPIDFPFGPYSDTFSEKQHKFGPFKPIALTKKSNR